MTCCGKKKRPLPKKVYTVSYTGDKEFHEVTSPLSRVKFGFKGRGYRVQMPYHDFLAINDPELKIIR